MTTFSNVLSRILDSRTVWLSDQSALLPMARRAMAEVEQDGAAIMPQFPPLYTMDGNVAVVSIRGVIVRECSAFDAWSFGLCSSSRICEAIKSAELDGAVASIFLDIDSPGGECCGTPECADVVAACSKPIAAWSGGLMASAAYYIGSHAKYVTASKSANVGSVGVICTTYDLSEMWGKMGVKFNTFTDSALKGTGNPNSAMTDEQRAYLQAYVDQIGVEFRAAVTTHMPAVKAEAMQGQCFIGAPAVAAGLIHEITTRDDAVVGLRALPPAASNTDTMTIPEQLAAAQSKLTAFETEHASMRADIAAKDATIAKLTADGAAVTLAASETASKAAADIAAKDAALAAANEQIATLSASAKTTARQAVELMGQVGQTPVVPAVEKKHSALAAAPKPLTGLARAIAAAKSAVTKN